MWPADTIRGNTVTWFFIASCLLHYSLLNYLIYSVCLFCYHTIKYFDKCWSFVSKLLITQHISAYSRLPHLEFDTCIYAIKGPAIVITH